MLYCLQFGIAKIKMIHKNELDKLHISKASISQIAPINFRVGVHPHFSHVLLAPSIETIVN